MPEQNGAWYWSRGEAWTAAAHPEELIAQASLQPSEEAMVFFPSRHVQLLQQQLSKAQFKQLDSAGLSYLLEEYVIQPIDQLAVFSHFQQPDRLSLLGIARHQVEGLQHSLALLPIKLVALLPDFLILPTPDVGQCYIANIAGRYLYRDGSHHGQSIDDLDVFIQQFNFAQSSESMVSMALSEQSATSQSTAIAAMTMYSSGIAVERLTLSSDTHCTVAVFDYQFTVDVKLRRHAFNVLPKQHRQDRFKSGYWRACAAVFTALLIAQFSLDAMHWYRYKNLADQTAATALQQYQDWFGRDAQLTEANLAEQFKRKVTANKNADMHMLQLLSRVGPVLMQHQLLAQQVRYSDRVLDLAIAANNADILQSLVTEMNQQGFQVELGNIQSQSNGQVLGMLRVKS
ncbi:type II secretion system protein GspL [Acinetobacter larvae]|nr:type II secretion system protein GspL [Acinetobacter larvae]